MNIDTRRSDKNGTQKLTLDRPAIYQIEIPGEPDVQWSYWYKEMRVTMKCNKNEPPVTMLISSLDQAALQGLLRHLYALGLPLISVNCLEIK